MCLAHTESWKSLSLSDKKFSINKDTELEAVGFVQEVVQSPELTGAKEM